MANVNIVKHDSSTNTHDVMGVGDTIASEYIQLSATAGNQLAANPDGLFVPPAASFAVNVDDSDNVSLAGDGSAGAPLVASAIIDPAADNLLSSSAAGLLASAPNYSATPAPATSTDSAIPTTMYGARTALLGEPAGWIEIGAGRKIPYWA